jgi:hypothetical protein
MKPGNVFIVAISLTAALLTGHILLGAAITAALAQAAPGPSPSAQGKPSGAASAEDEDGQPLGQAAQDPTASLMALQIANWYTASFHKRDDDDANSVVLRPVIPFKTGTLNHIFRVTVSFITDHPALDSGLSDLTLFDLMVFNAKWGRWGLGPVALLPTGGENRAADKWALGPAIGFVARRQTFLWGLFNQNLFSFAGDNNRADVNTSTLQPILNYGLGNGWSVGSSEMTFAYDWEGGRWSSLPLGVQLAKLVRFGALPVQLSAQYERDFADDQVGPKDTVRLSFKFLLPR